MKFNSKNVIGQCESALLHVKKCWNRMSGFLSGILIVVLSTFNLVAQVPTKIWEQKMTGSKDYSVYSVKLVNDGGYMVSGHHYGIETIRNQCRGLDYFIMKLDSKGNIQWTKSYGGEASDVNCIAIPMSDGGFVAGGTSSSGISPNKSKPSMGSTDYWILKVDEDGRIQWEKTIGESGFEQLSCIEQTADGGVILGGISGSGNSPGQKAKVMPKYHLVKLSAEGELEWEQFYEGKGGSLLTVLKPTSDNGFIMGGSVIERSVTRNLLPDVTGTSDGWIIKVRSDGSKEWEQLITGSQEDIVSTINELGNGEFSIGVFSFDAGIYKKGTPTDRSAFRIVSVSRTGEVIRERRLYEADPNCLNFIADGPDGDYVIGGSVDNDNDANRKLYSVVRIDKDGIIQSKNLVDLSGMEHVGDVIVTESNEIVIAGTSTGQFTEPNDSNAVGEASETLSVAKIGSKVISPDFGDKDFLLYPNPASKEVTVTVISRNEVTTEGVVGDYEIQDINGRIYMKGNAEGKKKFSVSISQLLDGTYFFRGELRGRIVSKMFQVLH